MSRFSLGFPSLFVASADLGAVSDERPVAVEGGGISKRQADALTMMVELVLDAAKRKAEERGDGARAGVGGGQGRVDDLVERLVDWVASELRSEGDLAFAGSEDDGGRSGD